MAIKLYYNKNTYQGHHIGESTLRWRKSISFWNGHGVTTGVNDATIPVNFLGRY